MSWSISALVGNLPIDQTMPSRSLTLAQFPHEMVEFACDKCGWRGRLHKAKLIEE